MDDHEKIRHWLDLPIPQHIKDGVDRSMKMIEEERYAELYPNMTIEEAKEWEAKLKNGMLTFKDEE
jgi:hypothetical protein